MSLTSSLLRLLGVERVTDRRRAIANLGLFTVGAALASCWDLPLAGSNLFIDSPRLVAIALGMAMALAALGAICIVPHRFPRLRFAALGMVAALHLFWLSAAVAFAAQLGWSVPTAVWILTGLLTTMAVATAVTPTARVSVPIALPLGIVISVLLMGWGR